MNITRTNTGDYQVELELHPKNQFKVYWRNKWGMKRSTAVKMTVTYHLRSNQISINMRGPRGGAVGESIDLPFDELREVIARLEEQITKNP